VHTVRLLADNTVDTRMYALQKTKMDQVSNALEHFQQDKSLGSRALRQVLGFRFRRQGDDDDSGLFKDSGEIEEDDDDVYDDSVEASEDDDEEQDE
jgi:hypothetical protein